MTQYQVQRFPMFKTGAEFENFLKPFSNMISAIISLESAKERNYGYEWRILPVVSETGRSKGYVNNDQCHAALRSGHTGGAST